MSSIVVYVAGGAMSGVYSAGVLDALARLGVREHVEAIYGISAGAFNAANFAIGETDRSAAWYTEHASSEGIIRTTNPFTVLRGNEVIDAGRAISVVEEHGLMNVERLCACTIPVYFGVVDVDTKEFVWLDARRPDAMQLLRASASLIPFSRDPVEIDGKRYMDGGYGETVALGSLRARHPGKRFIIIMNTRFDEFSLKRLAGYLVVRFHDASLADMWQRAVDLGVKELADAVAADDVVIMRPDADFPVGLVTTDTALVRRGFALGVEAVDTNADDILQFVMQE